MRQDQPFSHNETRFPELRGSSFEKMTAACWRPFSMFGGSHWIHEGNATALQHNRGTLTDSSNVSNSLKSCSSCSVHVAFFSFFSATAAKHLKTFWSPRNAKSCFFDKNLTFFDNMKRTELLTVLVAENREIQAQRKITGCGRSSVLVAFHVL